ATDSRGLSATSAPVRFQVGTPTVAINFQDATSEGFPGYLPDLGEVYDDRGNGHSYGWAEDIQAQARNRNNAQFSPDERYDTFNHSARPTNSNFWEIGVPNGSYYVFTVAGEASNIDSVYHFQAEGVTTVQGTPIATVRFFEGGAVVTAADGRLTLTNGPGSSNNKIAFLEIYARSGAAPAPVLSATLAGGNLTVTWTGGGTLESAAAAGGPW
ncbi:MAG TPA: hypothetical protein PKE47_10520, partial [Verrucomicrobiota bacterium]|nr:hypothetical protein [Verrucomicrobiota bacterium]